MDDTATLHGTTADISTPESKAIAVDDAFDYRGDVTIQLADGAEIVGFVSNRNVGQEPAWLEIFCAGVEIPLRLTYAEIVGIVFTGRDTAAGKSWETWLEKVEQAKANGTIVELYPDEDD